MDYKRAPIQPKQIAVNGLVTGFVTVKQGNNLILISPQQVREVALKIASFVRQVA